MVKEFQGTQVPVIVLVKFTKGSAVLAGAIHDELPWLYCSKISHDEESPYCGVDPFSDV